MVTIYYFSISSINCKIEKNTAKYFPTYFYFFIFASILLVCIFIFSLWWIIIMQKHWHAFILSNIFTIENIKLRNVMKKNGWIVIKMILHSWSKWASFSLFIEIGNHNNFGFCFRILLQIFPYYFVLYIIFCHCKYFDLSDFLLY